MSVEILARLQFAFTIAFHYIYPPLSIGLGVCLVIMEGLWLKTGNPLYHRVGEPAGHDRRRSRRVLDVEENA